MCGIHGILHLKNQEPPDLQLLGRMASLTVHRGPDDQGAYAGQGVAIGMRRLSIIDLAGGKQPIANEDGTLWVVCNGEIYNFRELRKELEQRGHIFKTGSDTEVLVHLYEEHGDGFVSRLNGMYGFALWDVRRQRLLVGRDRLGIKPIYYWNDGSRLIFASEAKAILSLPGMKAEIDPDGLAQYLALGYAPAPYSLFKGIRKLPIASMMVCERGQTSIVRYWNPPQEIDASHTEEDWAKELLERLEQAVVSQMVSDVPIGAFLSGGLDSSTVVAFMAKHSSLPVKTYAIGFDAQGAGGYYNELAYARQVSDLFHTQHKEILVRPDVVQLLPKLLWHMDEPIADSAFITTYLVAEFARRDVTVILSGVGGDELFGGYLRYLGEHYHQYFRLLPLWFRRQVVKPLGRLLPSDRHSPFMNLSRLVRSFLLSSDLSYQERYRFYVQVFSQEKLGRLLLQPASRAFDALGQAFGEAENGDPLSGIFHADLLTQLPDDLLLLTDKMTMATSLECRVPLLDHELVELCLRMPPHLKVHGSKLKHILKKAMTGILPDNILYRKKRGFGAPMGAWLKNELQGMMRSLLSRDAVEERGIFNWEMVRETVEQHQSSREDNTDHLLSLINFEIWCRLYLDKQTPAEVTEQLLATAASR